MNENIETNSITKIESHSIDITKNISLHFDEVVATVKGYTDNHTNFNINRLSYRFVSIDFNRTCTINNVIEFSYFMAILQSFTKNQLTKEPYTITTDIYMQRETVENTEVLTLCFKKKKLLDITKPVAQHILNILNKVYSNLSLTMI